MAKRAFLVGINQFRDSDINPLRGCVNDTRNVTEILLERYGFDRADIKVLHNEQATKAQYLAGLNWLLSGARTGDQLLLFTSSHGTHVPDRSGDEADGFDEVLVTYDHDWNSTLLTDDELATHMDRVPPGAVLTCLWDTCHSGTLADNSVTAPAARTRARTDAARSAAPRTINPPPALVRALRNRGATPQGFLRPKNSASPCISMAACKDSQTAADASFDGAYSGAFTHALLDSMRAGEDDSWNSLLRGVTRRLEADGFSQTPQLHVPTSLAHFQPLGGPARSIGGSVSSSSRTPASAPAAPANPQVAALDQQISQLEAAGRWGDVINAHRQRAMLTPEARDKAHSLERVMQIYHQVFFHVVYAIATAEELLQIDPSNQKAIAFLETGYAQQGNYPRLQWLQQHKASLASTTAQRNVAPEAPKTGAATPAATPAKPATKPAAAATSAKVACPFCRTQTPKGSCINCGAPVD